MRDDHIFELERAFDLLPHVVGASWATIWFRTNGQRRPSRIQFREKAAEYFMMLRPVYDTYAADKKFAEISSYIMRRRDEEAKKITDGENPEIEKRYDRYVDYG